MPANVGNQKVALKFYDVANANEVNERFKGIRQKGVYSGGRLSIIDSANAQLSPLVCEIGDGSHQVRVETTIAVNMAVAQATPYIVLRWTYTGAQIDYMEILTIATPVTNDLIVGKCSFDGGGGLQGFSYDERSTPNTHDLFLKVEPTEDIELRVRIRAGKIQTVSGVIDIPDQKSNLFTAPTSHNRIDLVYIKVSTGAVKIKQGVEAVSPVPPNYGGVETKLGLAEVLLTPSSVNITANMIKDVRNFITPPSEPDGITLERGSDGKWRIESSYLDSYLLNKLGQSKQVVGVTDISATPGWSNMADMSITMTTNGGNILLLFEAALSSPGAWGWAHFRFTVDGDALEKTRARASGDDGVGQIEMHRLKTNLSAGAHTFKVQWNEAHKQVTQEGSDWPRVFTVIELPN